MGEASSTAQTTLARLEYKQLLSEYTEEDDYAKKDLIKALGTFVKKHADYIPALQRLAQLDAEIGNVDNAARRLVEAAKKSGASSYWHEAARLWIDNDMAENALSAARTATKNTQGHARLSAEVDLIRLYIALGMLEDAQESVENFYGLARELKLEINNEMAQNLLVLKGLCLNRLGKYRESAEVWKKLSKYDFELKSATLNERVGLNGDAPSPVLSTP